MTEPSTSAAADIPTSEPALAAAGGPAPDHWVRGLPVLPGVLAGPGALLAGASLDHAFTLAILLGATGMAVGYWLAARQRALVSREREALLEEVAARRRGELGWHLSSITSIGEQVLPVWGRHIEYARDELESNVTSLAERFQGIVDHLREIVQVSTQAVDQPGSHGQSLVATFEQGRRDLGDVVGELRAAQAAKQAMLEEVRLLVGEISELSKLAEDVAAIADQTNLLALNAAIEAARA
ncbi:MAG: methyl-accepting chemotaxis protein, partial [Gammaproteobacteria bacterium]